MFLLPPFRLYSCITRKYRKNIGQQLGAAQTDWSRVNGIMSSQYGKHDALQIAVDYDIDIGNEGRKAGDTLKRCQVFERPFFSEKLSMLHSCDTKSRI